MADEIVSVWPIEIIPDEAILYRWLSLKQIDNGVIEARGAFKDDEMSVDWAKYSTPEITRARHPARPAKDFAVIWFLVQQIRAISNLMVLHDPIPQNHAHSLIKGPKDVETRFKLGRLADKQIIFFDDQVH